jgi:hypothetical protein
MDVSTCWLIDLLTYWLNDPYEFTGNSGTLFLVPSGDQYTGKKMFPSIGQGICFTSLWFKRARTRYSLKSSVKRKSLRKQWELLNGRRPDGFTGFWQECRRITGSLKSY